VELVEEGLGVLMGRVGEGGAELWIVTAPVVDGGAVKVESARGGRDGGARGEGLEDLELDGLQASGGRLLVHFAMSR
jgi:hypothetical protein